MNKILIVLCALFLSWTANAQTTPNTKPYKMKKGDNFYQLAVKYKDDGKKWKEILDLNPGIASRGVDTLKNGIIMAYPRIGEEVILTEEAYAVMTGDQSAAPILDGEDGNEVPEAAAANVSGLQAWINEQTLLLGFNPFWFLLVFPAGLLCWFGIRKSKRDKFNRTYRNPETAGAPEIPGGLTTLFQAATKMRTDVVNDWNRANPNNHIQPDQVRIEEITNGRLFSDGARVMVSYGNTQPQEKVLNGERGIRAVAVLPNGERRVMYDLAFCGNNVRAGRGIVPTHIRFVVDVESPMPQGGPINPEVVAKIETAKADMEKIVKDFLSKMTPAGGKITVDIDAEGDVTCIAEFNSTLTGVLEQNGAGKGETKTAKATA